MSNSKYNPPLAEIYREAAARLKALRNANTQSLTAHERLTIATAQLVVAGAHADLDAADAAVSRVRAVAKSEVVRFQDARKPVPLPALGSVDDLGAHVEALERFARESKEGYAAAERRFIAAVTACHDAIALHGRQRDAAGLPRALFGIATLMPTTEPSQLVTDVDHRADARRQLSVACTELGAPLGRDAAADMKKLGAEGRAEVVQVLRDRKAAADAAEQLKADLAELAELRAQAKKTAQPNARA